MKIYGYKEGNDKKSNIMLVSKNDNILTIIHKDKALKITKLNMNKNEIGELFSLLKQYNENI